MCIIYHGIAHVHIFLLKYFLKGNTLGMHMNHMHNKSEN
jgi:hypothetical protein